MLAMTVAGKSPDEVVFLSQLGLRVRRARAKAGLTRRALTVRSGVSERYLAQLESGEGNISILLIRRVAAALGADLHELIGQPVDVGRRGRIALVGLRGAGKSTLGARLAAELLVPFIELEPEVERELGASPGTDFATLGQDAYRDGERRALQRVIEANERCVIATGESLVVEPQTYQLLRSRCMTVWLSASPEDHMSRVVDPGDLRAMAGREQAMNELKTIIAQRERLHQLADATIDTSAHDESRCLQELLGAVRELGGDPGAAAPPASPEPA